MGAERRQKWFFFNFYDFFLLCWKFYGFYTPSACRMKYSKNPEIMLPINGLSFFYFLLFYTYECEYLQHKYCKFNYLFIAHEEEQKFSSISTRSTRNFLIFKLKSANFIRKCYNFRSTGRESSINVLCDLSSLFLYTRHLLQLLITFPINYRLVWLIVFSC